MTDETKPTMTPEEEKAFLGRVDAFFGKTLPERLSKALEAVNKNHPDLFSRVFVDLIRGGLESLRHYIEDPKEKAVSWESPWTELHYPVEWDWEGGDLAYLRPEDTPEAAVDTIAAALRKGEDPFKVAKEAVVQLGTVMLAAPQPVLLLLGLTNMVAVHVKGGEPAGYFFLDPQVKEDLDALPEDERPARMGALLRPLSIGAAEVNGDPVDRPEDLEALPVPEWEDIQEKAKALPMLTFNGEAGGVPFMGSVVLMIHPLVVDEDKREAYFPIVTGLAILLDTTGFRPDPSLSEDETTTAYLAHFSELEAAANPEAWSEEDRKDLWKRLLEDLPRDFLEKLGGSKAVETEPAPVPVALSGSSTMTADLSVAPPAALVPAGAPSPERRRTPGVAFGRTLASRQAMTILRDAYRVRLPKKWSTLPRWDALKKGYVQDLLEEEGDRAFEDLRKTTGDHEERGPLLRHVTRAGGKEEVVLTAEAEDRLRRRAGLGRGFLDIDRYGQERLYRLFEVGQGGLLEVGLSWHGLAGPLVEEWRADLKRQAKELDRDLKKDTPLFVELDEERRRRVDQLVSRIRLWEDGRRVMEAILGQVGKQRRNPVEIPAETFRVLLWPERTRAGDWPQNWKQRVEGALTALNALTFSLKTYRTDPAKGYGSMVGQWIYQGSGPGDHGDGVYRIDVSSGFLGCLQVFQSGKTRLRSGREAAAFHFTKDLSKEERKTFGWSKGSKATDTFVTFDAGRAFYNAAAGLTPTQENLLHFIESKITLRKHTTRHGNKAAQVPKTAPDAKEPRLYTSAFCPLLPQGSTFFGALGDFTRNAETGFTLGGTESRPSRHSGGLLHHMGYFPPSGSARSQRAAVMTKALEDFRAVVVDYLGGIVAGHDGTRWVPFEDFRDLDERTLSKGLHVFFFLPETWEETRRAQWEEATGRRVTEDPEEAEREAWEGEPLEEPLGEEVATEADGFRGWPLHRRLRAMMKRRGLRQKDLAVLFGVSGMTVSYWLTGKKKVPSYTAPLMVRWIEEEVVPTADELAASRAESKPPR